jgi:Tol biopolymer transport system component
METAVFDIPDKDGSIWELIWSPDQTILAFAVPEWRTSPNDVQMGLYYLAMDSGTIHPITNGEQYVTSPVFSSDGSRILFVDWATPSGTDNRLTVTDLEGQCHCLTPPVPEIWRVALSLDGSKIAFDTSYGLLVADTEVALGTEFWTAGEPCYDP